MKGLVMGTMAICAGLAFGAGDYPFQPAEMNDVTITGGFWLPRFETNRIVTVWTDFKKCEETGRIANFAKAGKMERGEFQGCPFDDSDVYKVVEGAAYTLSTHKDPKLEAYLDALIAKFAAAQEADGYLYTARTLGFKGNPGMLGDGRWSRLGGSHELYNLGHMYEAAVAYYRVTGKKTLLDVACKSADLLCKVFGPAEGQRHDTSGHEEIEIGLCKLYRATGNQKYLDLAKFFIDMRGRKDLRGSIYGAYNQDHLPVLEQKEAVGHAVRAGYLYSGMADVAALTGNADYIKAIDGLWENVAWKKTHLNGGIGARHAGEAFGDDYELPNETAYLETCANIANGLWNERMFLLHGDAKYIDILERVIYNGFLSGISIGGDEFFYPNPLASRGGYARSKWFGCSCCPVNVVRFIPQIATFAYAHSSDALYWNLFIDSDATLPVGGSKVRLSQRTAYPWEGSSVMTVTPEKDGETFTLNVRIPGWAVGKPVPSDLYEQTVPGSLADVTVTLNGEAQKLALEKGFFPIRRAWKKGDKVVITMNMPVRRIRANANVKDDTGRLAVERGPILYCAEGVDNNGHVLDKIIPAGAKFSDATCDVLGNTFPALTVQGESLARGLKVASKTAVPVKLIPYFAWDHRGADEMQTWFPESEASAQATTLFDTTASHCWQSDTPSAMVDGIIPKNSADGSIPRLTFWDHKGTAEWVQCALPQAEAVSGCDVYWFDDVPHGGCNLPASWKAQYRETADGEWKDIPAAAWPVEKDKFCAVKFSEPVKAQALRLAIQLQPGFSAGILEWKLY